jgi:hypothetical protein
MTYTMRKTSKKLSLPQLSEHFLKPPIVGSIRERCSWAKQELESQPAELLCNAMEALLCSSAPDGKNRESHQCALVQHFLTAFSLWCVGGFVPPECFRCASVCFSRGCDCNLSTCGDEQCNLYAASQSVVIRHDSTLEETRDAISTYSEHASLVGTTFWVLPDDPLVSSVFQHRQFLIKILVWKLLLLVLLS